MGRATRAGAGADTSPAVESKPSWDLVVGVAVPALLVFSGLNLGLRLWDSADATWSWLLPGSLAVGAAIIVWSQARPDQVGWWVGKTILLSWFALPLVSVGISLGRHYGSREPIPDWTQAAVAAGLIGMCVARLAMLWRDRLVPAALQHRVTVDLYASPMLEDSTIGIAPPPPSDGYYQARCRCGWRGPARLMDVETAEADAAADGTDHRAETWKAADRPLTRAAQAPGRTRPVSYATMTSCTRSRRPSLVMARATWVFAVSGLMNSRPAISSLDSPAGDERHHLALPLGQAASRPSASPATAGCVENRVTTRRVTLGDSSASPAATTRTARRSSSGSTSLVRTRWRRPAAPRTRTRRSRTW